MRVRKVDANGDRVFGGDQAAFERDTPDAVGIVVDARLHLWQGQWYLDRSYGLPVEQQVLGKRTEGLRDATIQAHILDTTGVTEIVPGTYSSVLDRQTRAFSVSATIQTAYSLDYLNGPQANATSISVKVEDGR